MPIELPDDVFLLIFIHLDWREIHQMRWTCKKCYQLTKQKSLWQSFLQSRLIGSCIPVPGLLGQNSVSEGITSKELERRVIDAIELHRNWTSPSPAPKGTAHFQTTNKSRIIRLHFLKHRGYLNRLLLSLSGHQGAGINRFSLQVWDIARSQPVSVAEQEISGLNSVAINNIPGANGIVAIHAVSNVVIYSVTPSNCSSEGLIINPLATFSIPTKRLHLFSGSRILSSDEQERLYLWDMEKPRIALQLRNLEAGEHQAILGAILEPDCIIVFRAMTLELYSLPRGIFQESTVIEPIVQHRWPWKLDSISVTELHRAPRSPPSNARPSIAFLIRFGSFFPWPVNLLHQFILQPNMFFQQRAEMNSSNLPYCFPAVVQQTISAPVRLFSLTDLALGPYGTSMWIDNHTEDYFGPADSGQRIAAKMRPPSPPSEGDFGGSEEQELSDQVPTSRAGSVFLHSKTDGWAKLAVNEEEGEIATGDTNGRITLLRFV